MKKSLLLSLTVLSGFVLLLTSCSREYHPQFAGRYHPKVQDMRKPVADRKARLVQNERIASLSKINDENPVFASNNGRAPIFIPQSFTSVTNSTFSQVRKPAKRIHSSSTEASAPFAAEEMVASSLNGQRSNKSVERIAYSSNDNQLLCAIISIFIPFLGVALYEDGITDHFWIDLILCLLFWLPGIIYALYIILRD